MASINKVIIVGNLGQDPETRQFDNGNKIATVSIATSERWTDKQTGEQREHTEWHRVVFNNRLADVVAQYLRKGSQIYVEGSLRTRKWQDQNGQDRYSTEIRADVMQMLGNRNSNEQAQGGYAQQGYNTPPQGQGYQGQQWEQHAPQGNPQTQNGGYAPPQPPQGQNWGNPPSQAPQGQQYATYPDGTPVYPPQPVNAGVGQAPRGQVSDDDMPF